MVIDLKTVPDQILPLFEEWTKEQVEIENKNTPQV
jgi:hypothetical protein